MSSLNFEIFSERSESNSCLISTSNRTGVLDVVFDLASGCLLGVVVPGERSFWNVFKSGAELFISLLQIVKVGEDAVLVELYSTNSPSIGYAMGSDKKKKK